MIGIAALAWVLRKFDFTRFGAVIAEASFPLILLVSVVVLVEQVIRGWKWRLLLLPLRRISTTYLFGAIMAGYLLATLVPFGFGTIARSWLVARRENLTVPAVLATVALDRLSDGLVFASLVPLAVLSVVFPDPTGDIRAGLLWGAAGSLVLFVLLIAGLEVYRRQAENPAPWVVSLRNRLPGRLAAVSNGLAESFAAGINWPREWWRGASVLGASLVMKLLATLQFLVAGLAFGVALRPAEYLFLMVFLGFSVILGHFLRLAGGFTIAAVFALGLFGIPNEEALAMTLVVQASNLLSVAVVGALALWAQGVAISEVRQA